MLVTSYKPQNPLLQKYIDCIYTLRRGEGEETIRYVAFPSLFSMVCLNKDSSIERSGTNLRFSHSRRYPLQMTLICDFAAAGWMRYEGAADEVVIYFKPLGLNAFLTGPLKRYLDSFISKFIPFDDYSDAMSSIFALNGDKARIRALEDYWVSKHIGFEHPFMNRIVDEMLDDPGTFSINEAAAQNNISRTTLAKHFDLHIGTTPSQFRKIARFRKAMKRHRQNVSDENLTDISHGVDYFDQSHMIKDFRSLTRYAPKTFFSRLSTLEDGQINWVFLPAS